MSVSRRHRVRTGAVAVAGAVTAATALVFAFSRTGGEPSADDPGDRPAATTRITSRTLVESAVVDAEVSYGAAQPMLSTTAGTVTWLAPVGSTVGRGDPLLRADDQPVILLYGALPLYRALAVGVEGRDVTQLEDNLRALGYLGFTVDRVFSDGTGRAVKRWQKDLGLPETGAVEMGRVLYAPGAIRVAEHLLRVGAGATGEVLTYTGTTKVVGAEVDAGNAGWARPGSAVTVVLPGGGTTAGTVREVVATPPAGDRGAEGAGGLPGAVARVVVDVADQRALGDIDGAPVRVRYVIQERKDVLTVPVAALLALAEGGYGLEVVEADRTRVVAVDVGLFAEGQVEVRGTGLEAGTTVGLPG